MSMCRVCVSPRKLEIENAWNNKAIARCKLQATFGIHETTIRDHMKKHVQGIVPLTAPKRVNTTCQTCASPRREEIETAWLLKRFPRTSGNTEWINEFSVSADAIYKHFKNHVTKEQRQLLYARATQDAAAEVVEADTVNIKATIIKLTKEAESFLETAKSDKDVRAGTAVLAELRRQIELFAKITGELNSGPSVGISPKSEGWISVRNILMSVLEDFPDAKAALVSRLGTLALEAR